MTDAAEPVNKWQQTGFTVDVVGSNSWGHEVQRYEFPTDQVENSDGLAPRDEVLERMLFATDERPSKGINFDKYEGIHVELEVTEDTSFEAIKSFEEAKLHPAMLENIRLCGYDAPTPIQSYSIPCLLAGNDLLAGAQTGNFIIIRGVSTLAKGSIGSGKTAAFLIPIISKLMGKARKIQVGSLHSVMHLLTE